MILRRRSRPGRPTRPFTADGDQGAGLEHPRATICHARSFCAANSGAAEDHLEETKGQIRKLEQVFKSIGKKASGEKCDAIEGLIKETDGLMEEASGTALDAGLLAACQAVEHYEISRYGSLREWAKDLGHDEAHKLLSEILDQEKATNNKLTNLAVTAINKTG